jgi:hypothetical protein
MKWLLVPILWLLALLVALTVLWRLWRGKPVVLRGRWTPRFVRMVVVILVVLGVGVEKTKAAPVRVPGDKKKSSESLPPTVTAASLAAWVELQNPRGNWIRFKQAYTLLTQSQSPEKPAASAFDAADALARTLPTKFRAIVLEDLKALQASKPAAPLSAVELTTALDELECAGYVDHWANAYLWRKSASLQGSERKAVIELFARLARHARLANTLIQAQGRVRPLLQAPRAWMSKGGHTRFPPVGGPAMRGGFPQGLPGGLPGAGLGLGGGINPRAPGELLAAARELYPRSDLGTWQRDGLALFTVAQGSAAVSLVRAGQGQVPQTQGTLRLGRLDLLETTPGDRAVVLEHAWLGRVELPAGKLLSAWDLPGHLSDKAKAEVRQTVKEALAGKEEAARRLEQSLLLTQSFIRAVLPQSPGARGAARLRMILALFDDGITTTNREPQLEPGQLPATGRGQPPK